MKSIIKVSGILLLFFCVSTTARSQEPIETIIEVQKLSDKVIVLRLGFLQTIAIASNEGIIVIDTNRGKSAGAAIRNKIAEEFGREDFAYVINTHSHYDHTGGNKAFNDITIIGHERCIDGLRNKEEKRDFGPNAKRYREIAEEFRTQLDTVPSDSIEKARIISGTISYLLLTADDYGQGFISVPPAVTFNERMTLFFGDLTLKLRYFGNAHTNNDILIHIPEEKLLLMGDIYAASRIPNLNENEQLEVDLWIANLNDFLNPEYDIKYIISGHTGDDMTIEDWRFRRDYIKTLWEGIATACEEGLTLEEVQDNFAFEKKFPEFTDIRYEYAGQNIHQKNVKTIWLQIMETK